MNYVFLTEIGIYKDIIYVHDDKPIYELMKDIVYQELKSRLGITKAEWHHAIFEQAEMSSKGSLPFVTWAHSYQMIRST